MTPDRELAWSVPESLLAELTTSQVAAGKGLMAGPVYVGLSNGSTVDASASASVRADRT